MTDLELAHLAVAEALRAGGTAADAAVADAESVEVRVRHGEVERVEQSRSRSLNVRAFAGRRLGASYTNDLSPAAVRTVARRAVELAAVAAEDAAAGLPDAAEIGVADAPLDVVDPAIARRSVDEWRDEALACERAALAAPGISMTDGARAGGARRRTAIANSRGLAAERERTNAALMTSAIATGASGERLRAHWHTQATHLADMAEAEAVGREAARRALRQVGWRRPPTGPVPVIFEPSIARDFAASLAQALCASAVYQRGTFLADDLGRVVGAPALSLVDDATLPRRGGSRPFDGEGVRSRRTPLFEHGRVASWLADSYSARRTHSGATGSAGRSASGVIAVAPSNVVLEAGARPPEALVADAGEGLYITDLFGFGVNLTTGTWSRGGTGMWFSGGRLAHAVQEFTVAGDLRDMLRGFRESASDLEWDGACAAPTVWIDGLTVAAG